MKNYIGTKLVMAWPMTRAQYNDFRKWQLPADESGADEGYFVCAEGGKPNHPDFDGYVSWLPREQFDNDYRETDGMTFGLALEALKKGKKVARAGWNGKGMWLSLSGDGSRMVHADNFWSANNADYARQQPYCMAEVLPCITMKTTNAHGRVAILMGWLASQTDMLSEDWTVVA